jgi:hypothetical protein
LACGLRARRNAEELCDGSKKVGKWSIQGDNLCVDLPDPDGGCFEVALSGTRIVMTPTGLGLPFDGILQAISDPK